MSRESKVLFAVLANALMGLGAFIAVIVGDINLKQILIGSGCGFLLSIILFRLLGLNAEDECVEPEGECCFALNDHPDDCRVCAKNAVA